MTTPVTRCRVWIQKSGPLPEANAAPLAASLETHGNIFAGTAVPVRRVLASESDPRFFGAPFLLLESIDAAHVPARADRFPGGRRSQRWGRSVPDARSSSSTTRP
jgi:hypothetical protein